MGNKEWDDHLKDMLGDFKPEGLKPDWDALSNYLHVDEQLNEWGEDGTFDENLKETVSEFETPNPAEGWERVEALLNLADQQFDEHVRNRIHEFEPKYNPHTWTLLMQRLSGTAYLRGKLIAFKVIEVTAVILVLFTFLKMGQLDKLPFETLLFDKSIKTSPTQNSRVDMANNTTLNPEVENSHLIPATSSTNSKNSQPNISQSSQQISGEGLETFALAQAKKENSPTDIEVRDIDGQLITRALEQNVEQLTQIPIASLRPLKSDKEQIVTERSLATLEMAYLENSISATTHDIASADIVMYPQHLSAPFIATTLSPIRWSDHKVLPNPKFVKQRSKPFTEFGIITQLDYNRLRMPEDKLYSAGKQIVFPQQGIASSSIGGGFSIAIAHPRWAVETGMVYSGKNFKPGRQLIVGGAFDNGTVEFEAMKLQMVSVPLHFRYKVDNKGVFKTYGVAGFGVHLITQSDIDVLIKYHFPSLSIGENPNNDPGLAQTIRETRRISEHIRDGAPFSTKSFLSANIGAGIEYSISETKTLFLQSAIQYQVPNLKFSNNNGKHLRSISIQAGVRSPLGK